MCSLIQSYIIYTHASGINSLGIHSRYADVDGKTMLKTGHEELLQSLVPQLPTARDQPIA